MEKISPVGSNEVRLLRLQNIAVPEDVHRSLKIMAVERGITLKQLVTPVLRALTLGSLPFVSAVDAAFSKKTIKNL